MKRIEVLAEKFKDVRQIVYLEEVIVSHMNFIKSIRGGDFIDTIEFFRESYEDQVENFDEFFEYVMFVMLENGFEVGNLLRGEQINKFPDGSIIDYNWDNEKKAKMIVANWNRSVEMFPYEIFGESNSFIIENCFYIISPRVAEKLKLKEIMFNRYTKRKR